MSNRDLRKFYLDYIEVLNSRQLHRLDEFVSDEVTYFGDHITREKIITVITAELDAVPDLSWELTDLRIHGDDLAARLVNTGTPVKAWLGVAPTGASFEIVENAVYRVRVGRFIHMANVHDSETLKQQLGG